MIHYRACNLCEAICGIEVHLDENQHITDIKGDKNDPFSRGHICPKALGIKDIYEDVNRLKTPIKRTTSGWEDISWEQAFDEIEQKNKAIRQQYGNDAVAMYSGNPNVHNAGLMFANGDFAKALNTKNRYSATSADQLPHHIASLYLYGHSLLVPIPDIDHTDMMVIMGGNPLASNGSMMTVPDVAIRLRAIQKRGGKVIVIDPRRTETARKADDHIFIKPATDVFFLLSLVQVLFEENLVNLAHLATFIEGLEELGNAVQGFTPEYTQTSTGVSPHVVRALARSFATIEKSVFYGRMGVSTQEYGGLCIWLINVINIITGKLDRKGGALFTKPAVEMIFSSKSGKRFNRYQSRVRKLPEFSGEFPVSTLADEILTQGEWQIKALFAIAGNPVLSTPNGTQLDEALKKLDLIVSIDIYRTETNRHAHYILPSATGLEVFHYDLTFNVLAVRNVARYSAPLFAKDPNAKYDWEILYELTQRLSEEPKKQQPPPETKLDWGLKTGPYQLSLEELKEYPHGMDLGELQPSLPARLQTSDKKIVLNHSFFLDDIRRATQGIEAIQKSTDFPMSLIGRRHLLDNNSWMHQVPRLGRGRKRCTALLHPKNAQALHITEGQTVRVVSCIGSIELPAEISDEIMPDVISIPHGYGHNRAGIGWQIDEKSKGVSINDITNDQLIDPLTGNAAFSNVPVRVEVV